MKNLAGRLTEEVDLNIKDELERAEIPTITVPLSNGEVQYTVEGLLGKIRFHRAWYYWVAEGRIPVDMAWKIYNHPEGKQTVRAGGDCGCPSPAGYVTDWYDKENGKKITKDYIKGLEVFKDLYKPDMYLKWQNGHTADIGQPREGFVDCYHIDEQAGLLLFSMIVRGLI